MRVVRFNGVWYARKSGKLSTGLTLKEALAFYENYAD